MKEASLFFGKNIGVETYFFIYDNKLLCQYYLSGGLPDKLNGNSRSSFYESISKHFAGKLNPRESWRINTFNGTSIRFDEDRTEIQPVRLIEREFADELTGRFSSEFEKILRLKSRMNPSWNYSFVILDNPPVRQH